MRPLPEVKLGADNYEWLLPYFVILPLFLFISSIIKVLSFAIILDDLS